MGGVVLVYFSVEGPPGGSARNGDWTCQWVIYMSSYTRMQYLADAPLHSRDGDGSVLVRAVQAVQAMGSWLGCDGCGLPGHDGVPTSGGALETARRVSVGRPIRDPYWCRRRKVISRPVFPHSPACGDGAERKRKEKAQVR